MSDFSLSFESPEVEQVELNTPESAASADRTLMEMELVSLTPAEMYAMEKRRYEEKVAMAEAKLQGLREKLAWADANLMHKEMTKEAKMAEIEAAAEAKRQATEAEIEIVKRRNDELKRMIANVEDACRQLKISAAEAVLNLCEAHNTLNQYLRDE